MIETIYISRHGSRQDWEDPTADRGPTGMYHDPSLSAHGLEQAESLAKFLSSPPDSPVPEMIFSSPFYRTVQTAMPLAQRLGLQVHLEMGVMEWFSRAKEGSGLHSRPKIQALTQHFPPNTLHPEYTSTYYPSRRGESLQDLTDRISGFLEAFLERIEEEYPDIKCIWMVAHAATVIVLGRALVGDTKVDIRAGTCSTSKYIRKGGKGPAGLGGWDLDWNARTDHLPDGEERSWSFDMARYNPDGSIVEDSGDSLPYQPGDEQPLGLAEGLEK